VKILDINLWLNWIGTIVIAIILSNFFTTSIKKKYYNPFLLVSVFFSFIGIIFENIMYHLEENGIQSMVNLFYALHITSFCIYFFYMYLFLNSLIHSRPSVPSLVFISGLIAIIFIGSWVHYLYYPELSYDDGSIPVALARLAFDLTGVYVFGVQGMVIYFRIYQKVKEKFALLFIFTQFSMMSGYFFRIFREINNLASFYNPTQINPVFINGLSPIIIFLNIFGMIGAMVYIVLYSINIKYIVRLPADIYFLGIYTISGLQIYKVNLKASKQRYVEDRLLSGIFSAFYSIFKTLFQSHHPIEIIRSQDFSLLFIAQEKIMVVAATEQPTYTLEHAMRQFFKQFTEEFPRIYEKNFLNLDGIERVEQILHERFPFLEIEKSPFDSAYSTQAELSTEQNGKKDSQIPVTPDLVEDVQNLSK